LYKPDYLFNMETTTLEQKIEEVVNIDMFNRGKIEQLTKFIEASKQYEILVEQGYTQKRGNNLISKDKAYRQEICFKTNY
jgi:N-acetylmuramoyl-L-alanine amidase